MYLGESAATIEDAVFFRNQADATGGAVYCWSASPADPAPSFSGVTFVENRADHGSGYGGTVDCGGASVHITESILAFTMSNQVVSCRNGAQPTITHCFSYGNALGDSLCGNHHDNVFEDPLFCDLGNGDLTLQDGSPCLPENNIWGVQIGAYAAGGCGTGIPAVPVPSPLLLVSATPNPSPGSARIECDIPVGVGSVRVVIYDPTGRCVRVLSDGPAQPGRSSMVWNGADDAGRPAASGVYFCRVTAGSEEASAKIVLVR
jgi:predicted outer membrane repeat protein